MKKVVIVVLVLLFSYSSVFAKQMHYEDETVLKEMESAMALAEENEKYKWQVYIARYFIRHGDSEKALYHYSLAETLSPQTGWVRCSRTAPI